jgi:hypothetical protein
VSSLMTALAFVLITAVKPEPAPDNAADVVTLRDGSVLLGKIQESAPRSGLIVIVRRAWAEKALPQLWKRWEAEEKTTTRRAVAQRRERLRAWKQDRAGDRDAGDRISTWIDKEIARLGDPEQAKSPLMQVTLSRGSVRGVVRRPGNTSRLLLLGWKSGFANVESLTLARLKDDLEGRGFLVTGNDPISVEPLLPIQSEPDARWLARRAATEVLNDTGLRFIRIQDMVMAEPDLGQAPGAADALSALKDLGRLLDENRGDPMVEKLQTVAKRGRVGAVVTEQATSPDFSGATVRMTLWVRNPQNRWVALGNKSATVRTSDLKGNETKDIEQDPQIQMVFKAIQALGIGDVAKELKDVGLPVGAAVQKALGLAREAFQNDLNAFALPLEDIPQNEVKPKPADKPKS